MPHFIIEHGNALASDTARAEVMQLVGQCGADSGFIAPENIKIRLQAYDDFLLLDGRGSFLHVTARLLPGRDDEQKAALSGALLDILSTAFPRVESISVEICDMDGGSYRKRLA